jgi:hypothetical protein
MTLSYTLRLMCLSMACFFGVLAATTLALRSMTARAIRRAERLQPRAAARLLFALRLLPAGFALFCVATLCVPSYLWFEPEAAGEEAGFICLIAAAFGTALWMISIARAIRAGIQSIRSVRRWEAIGAAASLPGSRIPIITIPRAGRLVALAGILRPRLILSSDVAGALDREQLEAAMRHEIAHYASRDNLKRLLLLIAPGFFLADLDRVWKQFAEWAADDRAVEGNFLHSVDLAEALVRVARLSPGSPPPALSTSLLRETENLQLRVNRLLMDRVPVEPLPISRWRIAGGAALALGMALLAPSTLAWVHRILERLMD